jgi:hypothetical protein
VIQVHGFRHRHLPQLRWWLLLEILTAPPRGPAIDVFLNFSGGCCWTFRQHPQGASHRRLAKLGTCRQYSSGDTYQGGTAVNTTTISKASITENEDKSCQKIFSGPCGAKNPGIRTSQKFNLTNTDTTLFIGMKKEEKVANRVGGLRVFKLALELLGYDACSIFNAVPGGHRKPFNGPLHRRLQGDAGVTTCNTLIFIRI